MKVTFELNLPENNYEYKLFLNAETMFNALLNIEEYIKFINKYDVELDIEDHKNHIYNLILESNINNIKNAKKYNVITDDTEINEALINMPNQIKEINNKDNE